MGGVALNRLKFLISTFHDWSKKTKITTGRIFLRLQYIYSHYEVTFSHTHQQEVTVQKQKMVIFEGSYLSE